MWLGVGLQYAATVGQSMTDDIEDEPPKDTERRHPFSMAPEDAILSLTSSLVHVYIFDDLHQCNGDRHTKAPGRTSEQIDLSAGTIRTARKTLAERGFYEELPTGPGQAARYLVKHNPSRQRYNDEVQLTSRTLTKNSKDPTEKRQGKESGGVPKKDNPSRSSRYEESPNDRESRSSGGESEDDLVQEFGSRLMKIESRDDRERLRVLVVDQVSAVEDRVDSLCGDCGFIEEGWGQELDAQPRDLCRCR